MDLSHSCGLVDLLLHHISDLKKQDLWRFQSFYECIASPVEKLVLKKRHWNVTAGRTDHPSVINSSDFREWPILGLHRKQCVKGCGWIINPNSSRSRKAVKINSKYLDLMFLFTQFIYCIVASWAPKVFSLNSQEVQAPVNNLRIDPKSKGE